MAVYKRKWWQYIFFETYLRIPFLTIQTRLLTEAIERMAYDICRIRIELWKWKWEFQLYKRPQEYYQATGKVPKKRNRANTWLRSKLAQTAQLNKKRGK